ncbi:MAG: DUF2442 domain-containing protein [Solirubrobacteraceae bacterium]|jgi:hypothetical protein
MDKLIPVTGAEVIGDHQLRVTFGDGLVGDIDFAGRHWRGVSEPLADPNFFSQARFDPEIRTVVWPNGFDMAPETLYERASEHQVSQPSRMLSPRS